MVFNIKRYLYGVKRRFFWFIIALLIPLIYFAGLSMGPDRFAVSKKMTAGRNLPVAVVANPMETRKLGEVLKDDQIFMQNNFNIQLLNARIENELFKESRFITPYVLKNAIRNNMKIAYTVSDSLHITYFGKKKALGAVLVSYYTDRLYKKVLEGLKRAGSKAKNMSPPEFDDNIDIKSYRSVWRPERIVPLALCSVASFVFILLIIGFLEWSDPSFKSERQMSRYLDLPVIGSLPDLNKISVQLEGK